MEVASAASVASISPISPQEALHAWLPLTIFLVFICSALTYGYLCDHGYLYERKERQVRLTCRTLKNKVDNTNRSGNRFVKEFDELFLYITDVLDFVACKYIDSKALPLLVQQEYNHARMHSANKIKHVLRFEPIRYAFDLLLLRAGKPIGLGLGCAIEIGTSAFIHTMLNQSVIPNVCSNATLFHLMEEVEHSCLTAGHLRPQVSWYMRLLLTPLVSSMVLGYCFGPVVTRLVAHPAEWFDWRTYQELAVYLYVFIPVYFSFVWEVLLHFAPPGKLQGETEEKRNMRVALMERCVKEQDIQVVIGETALYAVVM